MITGQWNCLTNLFLIFLQLIHSGSSGSCYHKQTSHNWFISQYLKFSNVFMCISGVFLSIANSMNFAASLCRRLNIKELVTYVPVYRSTSGITSWSYIGYCIMYFKSNLLDWWFVDPTILFLDVSGEGLSFTFRRWASKKTAGSTKNGRDSKPKNLGVKKFGGEVFVLFFTSMSINFIQCS